jgi:hypothetical protein
MQLTGTLKAIGSIKQVSEKFKSREFILTDNSNDKYPQHISIQLTQDKCSLIDNYAIGSELIVSININGKEWSNPATGEIKYFNTISAWKIEGEKVSQQTPVASEQPQGDDLPF